MKSIHPGFKAVADSIAKKEGVSKESANAMLASRTRHASAGAKRRNPRLKRVAGIIALIIGFGSVAKAQDYPVKSLTTDKSQTTILVWIGCEGTNCAGKTVDNTAGGVTLTVAQYSPTVTGAPTFTTQAQVAICVNSGNKIWVTPAPSATVTLATGDGQPIFDGGGFTIYGIKNITNFHAIRDAASNSTLFCDYYRQP